MIPAILGLGSLLTKVAAAAVVPRIVRALSALGGPPEPIRANPSQDAKEPVSAIAPEPGKSLYGRNPLVRHTRLYDAANKRWISRDPLGEGVDYNLYRYCGNSPIGHKDPSGLMEIEEYIIWLASAGTWESSGVFTTVGAGGGLAAAGPGAVVLGGGGAIEWFYIQMLEAEGAEAKAAGDLITTECKKIAKNAKNKRSPKQAQRAQKKGQAPKDVGRIDGPERDVRNSQWHAHHSSGGRGALNLDGSAHDGVIPNFSNAALEWLSQHGWTIP